MITIKRSFERGQALILIALAAIGLFGIAGLAIDGSAKFSDRRHAQNAADTAAIAAALTRVNRLSAGETASVCSTESGHLNSTFCLAVIYAAWGRAQENGYDGLMPDRVDVYSPPISGVYSNCSDTRFDCNDYVQVIITSNVNTTFARVIGITQTRNTVEAIALAKAGYSGPPFGGNALVSLRLTGNGYDAHGTPIWTITGGGIFVNSSTSSSTTCGGDAGVISPSITTPAHTLTGLGCHTVNVPDPRTDADQLTYADYSSWFPPQPACNGVATYSGGKWHPQAGADGSVAKFSYPGRNPKFAAGLYCIIDDPGSYNDQITGSDVTFYITDPDFDLKFNGGGNMTASAPTSGTYKGILMYLAPQVDASGNLMNTQTLDMRGNGTGDVVGTVIAPSATVTMFGNSGSEFQSQVIGYNIDTGGTANISVSYNAGDNWYLNLLPRVGLFQ